MEPERQGKAFVCLLQPLRLRTKVSRRELARRIGATASYVNDIEALRRKPPSKQVIEKIAQALEIPVEKLFD